MKDTSTMMKRMGMEFFISKTEGTTKDSGSMIKCMDLGSFTTKMVQLLMRVIGKMINLMDKVEFTTHSLLLSNKSSITKTSLS